ncbi:hypothetical protein TcasGA2_TC031593 [Tribolium castaneum]|uniref:Envelope fusion protein-like Protein n=1 Tax=Tribolium castaneum TaxID=7070 RepID=A0A139W8F3_TRICA|nr:hypothetical protein TcasGA2_TC031593 [Tribolium castaneum]
MLSIFAKDIDILSSRIDTIKHLAGGEISKETRKRRGLIDAGSSLLKWLIGTPSANDAKHYDEAINFLLNQSNEVQSLLKRQTTIMSSSIQFIAGDLFLCHNTLLYSTSETTICEVLLRIRKPLTIPESCDMKTVNASIEIYHQISSNEWLFITTKPVGAAIICEDSTSDVIDISLERTGLLKLSARCKCFTSSTTLIAVANKSSTFRNHIPDVQILPSNIKDSRSTPIRLETLRLSHENLDSLETSRKELKDINDELERQLSKPFVEKHFSSSNILWILTSLILVGLVLTIQHWIRKIQTKTTSPASTTVRFMAASERKSEVKSENTESPPTGVVKTFQTNRGV